MSLCSARHFIMYETYVNITVLVPVSSPDRQCSVTKPDTNERLPSAAMTTSRCTPFLKVLPVPSDSSQTECCLSDSDFDPMGSLDRPKESDLPGKATVDQSSPANGETQYYMQVSAKDGQLLSPIVAEYAKQSPPNERPMCRICHDGGGQEELLSPCECAGSLGTIHRSCLEHWLSASGTSFCELCHYQFTVQRKARPLMEWVRNPGLRQEKRTLFGDMVCFLLITPLATISGWLCLRGAVDHLHFSSRLEAVGLIALTVALFTIYLFWTLVSLRYHCRLYNEWRQTNQRVVLLLPKSNGEPSAPPSLRRPPREKRPSKETNV
uniref:RING-type E3 ubiquitin transferase n=1 Tax=Esox lucius TaxID=8010 RepID=A0AAY5L821_ESOLU